MPVTPATTPGIHLRGGDAQYFIDNPIGEREIVCNIETGELGTSSGWFDPFSQPSSSQSSHISNGTTGSIYTEYDDEDRSFTNVWAMGKEWTPRSFKGGSRVRVDWRVPVSNLTSGGGGYIDIEYSFDGGTSWISIGNSGHDVAIADGARSNDSMSGHIFFLSCPNIDFVLSIRFKHKSYSGTLLVNTDHGISTGELGSFWSTIVFTEILSSETMMIERPYIISPRDGAESNIAEIGSFVGLNEFKNTIYEIDSAGGDFSDPLVTEILPTNTTIKLNTEMLTPYEEHILRVQFKDSKNNLSPYSEAVSFYRLLKDLFVGLVSHIPMHSDALDVFGSNHGSIVGSLSFSGDSAIFSGGFIDIDFFIPYPFTVSVWIKKDDIATGAIIAQFNIEGQRLSLYTSAFASGSLGVFYGGASHWSTNETNIDTEWCHIVYVVPDNNVVPPKIYMNGVELSVVDNGGAHGGTPDNRIGSGVDGEVFFGEMSGFRIYNAEKDQAFIDDLYLEGR